MKKKNFKKDIMEISKISKNIPSLMETIHISPERERGMSIDEDDDFDEYEDEEPEMPSSMPEKPMNQPMQQDMPMQGKEIVDQIRKMALKAMAELADNTEDSYYSVLKKIWQMADKNPEDEKNKKME